MSEFFRISAADSHLHQQMFLVGEGEDPQGLNRSFNQEPFATCGRDRVELSH